MEKSTALANAISIIASIVTIITSFSVTSQIATGNPLEWLKGLDLTQWIILAAIVAATAASIIVIMYRKYKLSHRGVSVAIIRPYYERPIWLYDYPYAGVLWEVYTSRRAQISHQIDIQVRTPPKCPKCKTKLEESDGFFGGRIWKCIGCSFKKRNRDYAGTEAERVERLVERDLQENQNH